MSSEVPIPASLKPRMLAGLIDLVPSLVVLLPLAYRFKDLGFAIGSALVVAGFSVFEARGGQTPGKRALGLRVLHLDGTPCTTIGAVVRNLFRVIDAFGIYLIAVAAIAGNKRRQRIGDQAAGTSVYRV